MDELPVNFLEQISGEFINRDEALVRIDSINFLLLEAGLEIEEVIRSVLNLSEVARNYSSIEQIKALILFERSIDEALREPSSLFSRYIANGRRESPCTRLSLRCEVYLRSYERPISLEGLNNIANRVFRGSKTPDISRTIYGRREDKIGS